jgi:hypothetical protein
VTRPSAEPLVSFVIAVFNGARFLDDTLRSVTGQTYRDLEIVIVDDGSTDESRPLLTAWAARDARIRIMLSAHAGPQAARNIGVAAARGAFVAHLDHDDVAHPARIARQLAWMQNEGVDICGSCTRVVGDERYIGWVPERHDDILLESIFRCALIHPTVLMPAALAKAHLFNPRHRCGGDELPIRLALEQGCRLGNVPQPLIDYRKHATQRTRVETRAIRAHRLQINRRVFRHLFPTASAAEETAVLRVAARTPFRSRSERELAARWMTRFAAGNHPMLRQLMVERWAAVETLPT